MKLTMARRMLVPKEQVWDVLKDFGGHHNFNPYMEYAPVINGKSEGLGAQRYVTLHNDMKMKQTIEEYEDGHMMFIRITESTWRVKDATLRITLEPDGADRCVLTYLFDFDPPFGWLGPLVGLYYKPVFIARYNLILRSVEHFLLTGEKLHLKKTDVS